MMLDFLRLGLISIATVACATASAADSVDPIDRCPVQGCGSNTPVLSGSRWIESLNVVGRPDASGTRYVPGSFRCKDTSAPLDLGVNNGMLRGVRRVERRGLRGLYSEETVLCEGPGLMGASFMIEVTHDARGPDLKPERVQTEIRIVGFGKVSTWHVDDKKRESVPTYRLEWKVEKTWTAFCPMVKAWMEPWQVTGLGTTRQGGVTNPSSVGGAGWHDATDHALILHGETYTSSATVDPQRYGPLWFSIGCAGAAFSKMRLLGYNPVAAPSRQHEREATLKMITARYRGDKPHTEPLMPLAWISMSGDKYFGNPAPDRVGPLEALWNHEGASCLSHSRLWRRHVRDAGSELREVMTWVGSMCPDAATALVHPTPSPLRYLPPPGTVWATATVDHVAHLRRF